MFLFKPPFTCSLTFVVQVNSPSIFVIGRIIQKSIVSLLVLCYFSYYYWENQSHLLSVHSLCLFAVKTYVSMVLNTCILILSYCSLYTPLNRIIGWFEPLVCSVKKRCNKISAWFLFKQIFSLPVSYTHLDVYKRQI